MPSPGPGFRAMPQTKIYTPTLGAEGYITLDRTWKVLANEQASIKELEKWIRENKQEQVKKLIARISNANTKNMQRITGENKALMDQARFIRFRELIKRNHAIKAMHDIFLKEKELDRIEKLCKELEKDKQARAEKEQQAKSQGQHPEMSKSGIDSLYEHYMFQAERRSILALFAMLTSFEVTLIDYIVLKGIQKEKMARKKKYLLEVVEPLLDSRLNVSVVISELERLEYKIWKNSSKKDADVLNEAKELKTLNDELVLDIISNIQSEAKRLFSKDLDIVSDINANIKAMVSQKLISNPAYKITYADISKVVEQKQESEEYKQVLPPFALTDAFRNVFIFACTMASDFEPSTGEQALVTAYEARAEGGSKPANNIALQSAMGIFQNLEQMQYVVNLEAEALTKQHQQRLNELIEIASEPVMQKAIQTTNDNLWQLYGMGVAPSARPSNSNGLSDYDQGAMATQAAMEAQAAAARAGARPTNKPQGVAG